DHRLGKFLERRMDAPYRFDVGRFEQRVIVRPVRSGPLSANFHLDWNRPIDLFRKSGELAIFGSGQVRTGAIGQQEQHGSTSLTRRAGLSRATARARPSST